ncbi:MAG: ORF6N domain-containing protein [Elusimicrobiota bacterium]|nr:ORF6N domain-containing protein [Elusimicrobiota bacterium]
MSNLLPVEIIASKIFLIRGQKVMIDRDLAELYGVSTKRQSREILSGFLKISWLS